MSLSKAKRLVLAIKGKPATKKIDLNKPVASMTYTEQESADSVMIRESQAEEAQVVWRI
jgi:hypothetical protein